MSSVSRWSQARQRQALAFLEAQRAAGQFNVFASVLDLERELGLTRQEAICYRNDFVRDVARRLGDPTRKSYWRENGDE